MATRCRHLLSMAFVAATAAACATATARFYTLDPTAQATDAPAAQYAVLVGPVSIPPSVDRPQFAVQAAPNRIEFDEFNRWAAPLNDGIARAVAGDLVVLLGTPHVATAPVANFDATYRVTIDVQRFESLRGDSVLIDAVWTVRPTAGGKATSGRTVAREAAHGKDFDALAAAHSQALVQLSSDIATAIRAAATAAALSPVPTPEAETGNARRTVGSKERKK
jgi:uncharacterized lipoprotein YmbA